MPKNASFVDLGGGVHSDSCVTVYVCMYVCIIFSGSKIKAWYKVYLSAVQNLQIAAGLTDPFTGYTSAGPGHDGVKRMWAEKRMRQKRVSPHVTNYFA